MATETTALPGAARRSQTLVLACLLLVVAQVCSETTALDLFLAALAGLGGIVTLALAVKVAADRIKVLLLLVQPEVL